VGGDTSSFDADTGWASAATVTRGTDTRPAYTVSEYELALEVRGLPTAEEEEYAGSGVMIHFASAVLQLLAEDLVIVEELPEKGIGIHVVVRTWPGV
jgi:hypothetical protein